MEISNMTQIRIPNVPLDERIGSAFNDLFVVINQTECTDAKSLIYWDFSQCKFFHPFFLAPLAIYLNNNTSIHCVNIPTPIKQYFDAMHFLNPLQISSESDLTQLDPYRSKAYTPICKFGLKNVAVIDAMQTVIQNVIEHQSKADIKIKTPLSYFLGELICNISQHAHSEYGYIYSQYLEREKCIDICIADSGITIYGSYIRANKYIEQIEDSEAKALKLATMGYSTKNLPSAENRGYGISTTKQMLVEGLKGEFFMLSGSAFHRHITSENKYIQLPNTFHWDGTIILMRIPVNVPEKFDYNKYID